eukprot:Gregarina_sp_Pseudo_9__1207@NODE_1798_length_1322_cov_7_848792_g1667_i0_p1_GENE_NODE_1798_length_1322_cov_7_848792_g1667_i0NODE_1798_length_1322_cov_7_848792_g1667_i0_p1_ORF_typecomplete_len312_score8_61PIN_6/PF17146_4/8_6e22PIN_6/PF17146_4/5_3e03NOB1_Zn_bind/PF08772_11/1_6e14DZR/PF12773_7/0_085UPF0547/PF10571_9/7_2UPF0547/PF10571_9/61Nudix_N_2/PF14803_6/31Nudix_N_2/PF14803_6/20zfribbon_3/PF13248_6/27_NODE_1798_length_1322_cov_7_848792_g1667_i02971232
MSLPAVVVDTGAILRHASFLDPNISYYAPSCVIAEVQDKQGREYFERIASFLTIQEPESTDVDFVRQLARVTGDFPQLSAQDIRVLALVVQLCRSRNLSVRSIEDAKVLLLRPDIRRKRISNGGAASVETKEHEAEPAVGDGQASDNKEDKIFVTEFVTEYDKDDGEGQWITSENFEETSQSHTKEVEMDKLPLVSCVTGDFSMQNVLFVLGVPVVSPHGKRIQTIRRWAQICSACGTVEKEAKSPFCRACGYASLRRVPLTMGKSGQERVILRDRRANLKGTIFKAPTPLGGKQTVRMCRCLFIYALISG